MTPRLHNVVSYTVTLLVFLAVGLFRRHGSFCDAYVVCVSMWSFHFLRRTLESAFLHIYTKPVIAVTDVVAEYIYYWGFAFWIAWATSSPDHELPSLPQLLLGILVFALAEAGNFTSHVMLRRLRKAGSRERYIPRGFMFEYVSSPHYFFEVLSWVGFAMVARTWGSVAFLVVGACILGSWARNRHNAYKAQFDGRKGNALYPDERRSLVPFVF